MSWDLNIKEEIVDIRKLLEEVVAKLSKPCEEEKGLRFYGVEASSSGLLEIDGALPALKWADDAERSKIVDDLHLIFGEEEE